MHILKEIKCWSKIDNMPNVVFGREFYSRTSLKIMLEMICNYSIHLITLIDMNT